MNCSECQARLSAFYDGEAATDRAALETHLNGCAA